MKQFIYKGIRTVKEDEAMYFSATDIIANSGYERRTTTRLKNISGAETLYVMIIPKEGKFPRGHLMSFLTYEQYIIGLKRLPRLILVKSVLEEIMALSDEEINSKSVEFEKTIVDAAFYAQSLKQG